MHSTLVTFIELCLKELLYKLKVVLLIIGYGTHRASLVSNFFKDQGHFLSFHFTVWTLKTSQQAEFSVAELHQSGKLIMGLPYSSPCFIQHLWL